MLIHALKYKIFCLNIKKVRTYSISNLDIVRKLRKKNDNYKFYLRYLRKKIINNYCFMNIDTKYYGTNTL